MKLFCKRSLCLALALVLCAGLLPAMTLGASAATLQERQQAVVAVAWAYFDKGHSMQYDGATVVANIDRGDVGKTRSTNRLAPEVATPNETVFTVCSDFADQCYWEAFRYSIIQGGTAGDCWTGALMRIGTDQDKIPNNPVSVFHWEEEKNPDVPIAEACETLIKTLQPGDVITLVRKDGSGHTEVYVGDALGDGIPRILDSDGSRMNVDKQIDSREYKSKDDPEVDNRIGVTVRPKGNGGTILLSEAEVSTRNLAKKSGDGAIVKLNAIRPLNAMSESEYPITPATKYRMTHPRLSIDRMLNKTRFMSAYPGETVTMTLKLANSSKEDYSVPVTEKTPAGAKLKTPFAGAKVAGETQTFDVELKAGESKTFTCEFEITAARGETVTFDGGSVGDIPSNSIPIRIGGKKLTAEENAKLAAIAKSEYKDKLAEWKPTGDTLADVVYQKVLGLNVKLPEYKQIGTKLIKATKTPLHQKATFVFVPKEEVAAEDMEAFQTMIPGFRWGSNIWIPEGLERCSDPRDMHLEPGDVIVRSDNIDKPGRSKSEQLVYLGEGKYLYRNGTKRECEIVEEPELFRSIFYKVFYALRPTLVYDDVHTLPALTADAPEESKLKFTDVKTGDWFYEYVRDLVEDGTVNGMTETTFVPNGTLTYGQALKLIALTAGAKEPEKTGAHWASGYLTLAKEKKWLDGDVNLDGAITRLQFCKIAAKAKKITRQPASNPFDDTKDLDVLALYKAGVINGMSRNVFQPDGLLTRAQIAKIIWVLRQLK